DPRENDLLRIPTRLQGPEQFASGNYVEAAAFFGESSQQRNVGIGLDGKTNDVRNFGEGLIEDAKVPLERREAVHISGRADFVGDPFDRHSFAEQLSVALFKKINHGPRVFSTSLDGSLKEPSLSCAETR